MSIINYRTAAMTMDCVRSVLEQRPDPDVAEIKVVIVDNHSDDGSVEEISAWITQNDLAPWVALVASSRNAGFSGGHNVGISQMPSDFSLILNSDALIRPGFFEAILECANEPSKPGIVCPRLEYEDGTQQISCFRFPTPLSELSRAAASGPISRLLKSSIVALDPPYRDRDIEWASFACVLLRGDMIKAIGPIDEGYFLYFEDTEFCLRARRAGWEISHAPDARAVHFRGGSAPVKSLSRQRARLPRYYYASRTRFFCQAYGRTGLLLANVFWVLGRTIAVTRSLFGKPPAKAHVREARDLWTNFTAPLKVSDTRGEQ